MLEIERGRHTRPITPVENRRCPKCNVIENEIHFVLECTINQKERLELFDKMRSIDSYYIDLPPEIPPGAVFCGGWPKMVALTGV